MLSPLSEYQLINNKKNDLGQAKTDAAVWECRVETVVKPQGRASRNL